MPDQDNVPLEKFSLSTGDFADDLRNNDFGIEDTQVIASKDLQSFLMSDPDDVKSIEDDAAEKAELARKQAEAQKQQQSNDNSDKEKPKPTPPKKEKPDGKDALEDILFTKNEEGDDVGGTPTATGTKDAVNTPSEEDSTYDTLAKDLLRLGVFSKNSDDESEETLGIKTPEEFLERFNLEKKKGAVNILDNFLSQFGEDYRKMFDAVFVNGVKPQDYIQTFNRIETIKGLDLTNEDNQERIVRSYYKNLKMDDAKIEARIQKMKDYGDLEEEAKAYHEVLLNKEQEQATELENKKKAEAQAIKQKEAETFKSYQRILTEKLKAQEVDGIPLTQKDSEETLKYLTEKKYKLESGELLSEFDKDLLELNRPENHEIKIKLGLLLRKKLDLTSVKKTTISKKSDALFTLSTKNAKQNPKEKEIKSFFQ